MDSKKLFYVQFAQLGALSIIHFSVDIFAGMLPVILPAVQERFSISVAAGIALVSVLNLVCNFTQVAVGHIGAEKDKPWLMYLGIILMGAVCFSVFLPQSPISFWLMMPLLLMTALGLAVFHPESLRTLHGLEEVAPSLGSSIFLNSGYSGYSAGGWISAILITKFGFIGLLGLLVFPAISLIIMIIGKFKVAVEGAVDLKKPINHKVASVSFFFIMMMAIPATTVSTLIGVMIPQKLNMLDFPLTFGGFSMMVFISGTVLGTFLWAWLAHKFGELVCSVAAFLLGVPFLLAYIFMIEKTAAVWLLFVAGATANAAYPLLVTLARFAKGMTLGRRMGFAIGGAWGVASLFLLILAPVVEKFGPDPILYVTPMFYLFAAVIGINVLLMNKKSKAL